MFELRLRLTRLHNGDVRLAIPLWQRLVFVSIAALAILAATVSSGLSIPGGIFAVVALLGALYEDRWTYDAGRETLCHRLGLLCLSRKRSWKKSDIASVELKKFRNLHASGRRQTEESENSFARFLRSRYRRAWISVGFTDVVGNTVTMETHREREHDALEQAAEAMAESLGVYLITD